MFSLHRNKRKKNDDIAPDEIFLDAHNSPRFDTYQFEGRIERPIGRSAVRLFAALSGLVALVLIVRVYGLQIRDGEAYYGQAENNRLDSELLFAERGVIYDRNGIKLAWNEASTGVATTTGDGVEEKVAATDFAQRVYIAEGGFSHLLGFVSYPQKDSAGNYFQTDIIGRDGVERIYDPRIAGVSGRKIVERDALGEIVSESVIDAPQSGEPLYVSVDSRIQAKLFDLMSELADSVGFAGGASVIIDVRTGELLAMVSFPEYDSNIMTGGDNSAVIAGYQTDTATPFLNRAIGGLYTPGSIIKPFVAVGALEEGVIDPLKQIYSDGALRLPNPYDPDNPTIFNDWKAHGWVDMRHALAVSSNVYFFHIGGGFEDQRGIGIAGIEKYAKLFGIGDITGIDLSGEVAGVIPSEAWKREVFPDDPWRVGDTYNTSIGQYGFQATPLQMARAMALIANDGLVVTPHVRMDSDVAAGKRINVGEDTLRIVREGMRIGALEGTAKALNVPYVELAAKTGTAELGVTKQNVNSWVMGFWPYEEPRYAFATVMEKGPATNLVGSASVMRGLLDWMSINTPEYFE